MQEDLNSALDDGMAALQAKKSSNGGNTTVPIPEYNDIGSGKYRMCAMISHIGRNTDHGHYVCHVKKDDKWVLFDDDRVAHSKAPPFDKGFMYLFKKI